VFYFLIFIGFNFLSGENHQRVRLLIFYHFHFLSFDNTRAAFHTIFNGGIISGNKKKHTTLRKSYECKGTKSWLLQCKYQVLEIYYRKSTWETIHFTNYDVFQRTYLGNYLTDSVFLADLFYESPKQV
jgi:hypothetical protein